MDDDLENSYQKIAELIDRIQDVLDGQPIENVMPALCALLGHAGYEFYSDDMSKQKFIAQIVSEVEDAYQTAKKGKENG